MPNCSFTINPFTHNYRYRMIKHAAACRQTRKLITGHFRSVNEKKHTEYEFILKGETEEATMQNSHVVLRR